jgi:hypothetical protein
MKTRFILLVVVLLGASPAYALSCREVRQNTWDILSMKLPETEINPIQSLSGKMSSMAGTSIMVMYSLGENDAFRGGGVLSGFLTSVSGLWVYLASFRQTEERAHPTDSVRNFRSSAEYTCLKAEMGKSKAEEFLADVASQWEPEALARKYLNPQEQIAFITFITQ